MPFPGINRQREELLGEAKSFDIPKRVLWKAYKLVRKNEGTAGIDGQTLGEFDEKLADNLYKLWNRMSSGSYQPKAVRRVSIPKKSGGTRPLGIPTVTDRIAQMTARLVFEPMLEPHFHDDSYGYRPGKSAHQALEQARQRCWGFDWVIDLDIKGFFDTIDHELMLKAVDHHKPPAWVRLYVERWLKAPAQDEDGMVVQRRMGTPQGGVISPLLANLFLHYAFDAWMNRKHANTLFERYADDIVIHCRTRGEAEKLLGEIAKRLAECKLCVHPEKTKIVYCKDRNRTEAHEKTEFDFLGYTFRPRTVRSKNGMMILGFTPAISKEAAKAIRETMRSWKVHKAIRLEIHELASMYNPKIRGWLEYYGKFRPAEMYGLFRMFQRILEKWARKKYRRLKHSWILAGKFLTKIARSRPYLFAYWERGWYANGGI
jgi:group II intron reverse transcriptase/maturase